MKLMADESVDARLVARLRADGHDVISIAEISPSIRDFEVLEESHRLQIVLLTEDKDFGELVYREKRSHAGVLLIRLNELDVDSKYTLLAATITTQELAMPGSFSVLSEAGLRSRPKLA